MDLQPGAAEANGSPTWLLHDPVRNKFFRLGPLEVEVLARLRLGSAEAIAADVGRAVGRRVTADEITRVIGQFDRHGLFVARGAKGIGRLLGEKRAARRNPVVALAHNYLFFRVPLLRPDTWLGGPARLAAPFFSAGAVWLLAIVSLLGIYLVSRQLDQFATTIIDFVSVEGVVVYTLAMALTKILHEFGHALNAKRLGCRIRAMGVAFLVLWPILYTDTTDAWRLRSRRRRALVSASGIYVELWIAALCLYLWLVLPDGPIRGAVFALAATNWLLSLGVNLNPFMRFDGYFLTMDLTGIDNLQERSFGLAKWKLREVLFGLGDPPPEHWRPATARWLIVYAYGTWIYRALLFLGIAVIVYYMVFQALGVILFLVEIVFLLAMPVWKELKVWWGLRERMRMNWAVARALLVLVMLGLLAGLPLWRTARVPAVARPASVQEVQVSRAGRLEEWLVAPGAMVSVGQPIARLAFPDQDHEAAAAELEITTLSRQIVSALASDTLLDQAAPLAQERVAATRRRDSALRAVEERTARSLAEGRVVDRNDQVSPGQFVASGVWLARVVDPSAVKVVAFVAEDEVGRLEPGAAARFIPEAEGQPSLRGHLVSISPTAVEALTEIALASTLGGPLQVREDGGALVPLQRLYRLDVRIDEGPALPPAILRGTLHVDAAPRSMLGIVVTRARAILRREFGI